MASTVSTKGDKGFETTHPPVYDGADSDQGSTRKGDLLNLEGVDPVLNHKMHLVNNAIDEIGFTPYHAKLFVLNGFGCVNTAAFVWSH